MQMIILFSLKSDLVKLIGNNKNKCTLACQYWISVERFKIRWEYLGWINANTIALYIVNYLYSEVNLRYLLTQYNCIALKAHVLGHCMQVYSIYTAQYMLYIATVYIVLPRLHCADCTAHTALHRLHCTYCTAQTARHSTALNRLHSTVLHWIVLHKLHCTVLHRV